MNVKNVCNIKFLVVMGDMCELVGAQYTCSLAYLPESKTMRSLFLSDVYCRYNFFKGCPQAKTCTIIIRGGAEQFMEETHRSLHDAIMIVRRAMKNDSVVAGMMISNKLALSFGFTLDGVKKGRKLLSHPFLTNMSLTPQVQNWFGNAECSLSDFMFVRTSFLRSQHKW